MSLGLGEDIVDYVYNMFTYMRLMKIKSLEELSVGTLETDHSLKSLRCKHTDLSLISITHLKKEMGMVAYTCEPMTHWPANVVYLASYRPVRDHVSKIKAVNT